MKFTISKLYTAIKIAVILVVIFYVVKGQIENHLFKKVIERLTADSRVAEVIVTDVRRESKTKKTYTTIKFLEYDTKLNPLEPKYFTFSGNVIQFQSMVMRFDDFYVKKGHPLKGKSAYLFMKAFMLTDRGAETFEITKVNEIPSGYKTADVKNAFEKRLWKRFWEYALNPKEAGKVGIKNAQIEAPGTKFIPGMIYTIKIEHDGGLRIDAKPVAPILKNEKIKF
ncbi:MAG: hypothetical protein A3K83_00355 [Omnitrophica WOR_2 bacterium RBG_13_44_8b]|nr:MAG: hypothetical protein A3K83_00355 [Omnitrophica WOR_2 bacterium RBG_13_44_8b]